MSYKQVYKGGTFGPGQTFPEFCEFENCTFLAQCKFGVGCHFINCKFKKCCPKHYTNPWSIVKESILENCSLEYVVVDAKSLLKSPKIIQASVAGRIDPGGVSRGPTSTLERTSNDCCGNSITSAKADSAAPHCKDEKRGIVDGYHDTGVEAKINK